MTFFWPRTTSSQSVYLIEFSNKMPNFEGEIWLTLSPLTLGRKTEFPLHFVTFLKRFFCRSLFKPEHNNSWQMQKRQNFWQTHSFVNRRESLTKPSHRNIEAIKEKLLFKPNFANCRTLVCARACCQKILLISHLKEVDDLCEFNIPRKVGFKTRRCYFYANLRLLLS